MTMTEKMVEAVFEHRGWLYQPGSVDEEEAKLEMVAALKALREPTEAMINDGCHKPFFGESPRLRTDEMIDTWQAMIDAAINEKQPA